jgi:hypothetical protein
VTRPYDLIAPSLQGVTSPSSAPFVVLLLNRFGLPSEHLAAFLPPLTSVGAGGVFKSFGAMVDTMRVIARRFESDHTGDGTCVDPDVPRTLAAARLTVFENMNSDWATSLNC